MMKGEQIEMKVNIFIVFYRKNTSETFLADDFFLGIPYINRTIFRIYN